MDILMNNAECHTAQQCGAEGAPSMRAEDDHVGIYTVCSLDNFFHGVSHFNQTLELNPVFAAGCCQIIH